MYNEKCAKHIKLWKIKYIIQQKSVDTEVQP